MQHKSTLVSSEVILERTGDNSFKVIIEQTSRTYIGELDNVLIGDEVTITEAVLPNLKEVFRA